MRTKSIGRSQLLAVTAALLIGVTLSGCGGSAATPAATPATLGSAVSVLQHTLAAEAPHVVNSSVVTGFNWGLLHPGRWKPLNLIATAYAADSGLSAIWDPQNGGAPVAPEFAVLNPYNGGGFSCTPASNTCTNGSLSTSEWESLKSFIGQELDPNFTNSNGAADTVFGRLNSAVMVVCVIGQLVPAASIDADGLPMAGALTISLPADTSSTVYQPTSAGGCGLRSALAGDSLSATVTAVSSASYSKQLALSVGAQPVLVWLGMNAADGDLNIMVLEDQRPGGSYDVSRTMVRVTGINSQGQGTVLLEYLNLGSAVSGSALSCWSGSQWTCSYEFHRVYINEATDQAFLVSNIGLPGDASGGNGAPVTYVQYTVAAQPSAMKSCTAGSACPGTLALSFTADGQYEPNTSTVFASAGMAFDGCVGVSDRTLSEDGVLTCDVTGSSILASGGASSMIEQTRQFFVANVVASLLDGTSASTQLAFTGAADIYTAADSQ